MKNNIDKENNTLKIITSFILLITIVILILICLKPNSKNNYEKKGYASLSKISFCIISKYGTKIPCFEEKK